MKKLLIIMTLLAAWIGAAAQSFKVVPPRNVIAGQRFQVTFRLTNGEGSGLNAPAITGCKLLSPSPGVSTMQSYQYINGQSTSTSTVDYTFTYRAEKEGTFTIPAASINVDGKKLTTQPAKFTILPADKATAQNSGQGGGYPQVSIEDEQSQNDTSKPISKDDIFVRIILNKSRAYEQEAIECVIKLYTKYERINSFMMTSPPTFDGFLIEEVDAQSMLNQVEHYNGQNYITAVLKRCIIFPQKSGKLTINSGKYDLSVVQLERVSNGWFYSARPVEKSVRLQPYTSTVNITPLPEPRPAGVTNAVGRFQFDSSLTPQQLRTGEAASLTYVLTGTGNIKYIDFPKPEIPSEFEQYTPKTDTRARVAGNTVTGTMTVDYTVVPQSVGDFKIPRQEFVYFDPASAKYVTLSTEGYNVSVAKGSGTTISNEQREIEAKNTDILHIKTGDKGLSKGYTPVVRFWWYWALFGLILAALIVTFFAASRRDRLNADIAGRRNARANKVARKRLKAAEVFMKNRQSDKFYEETLRAMWGYLSDKLNIPASQLTRDNIVARLTSKGVSPEIADRVIAILDQCEMARYTPDSSAEASVEALYNETADTINAIEKTKIGR